MIIESHAHYSHKRYDGTFRYLTGQLTAEEGNRARERPLYRCVTSKPLIRVIRLL